MCIGMPKAPKAPPPPAQRQAAKQPAQDARTRLEDSDRRRRGYASTMFMGANSGATTSNVLGV